MNRYMKIYIVGGFMLMVLMGILWQSALGQKVLTPSELQTEAEVKDTFLTRIISKSVDLDKSELIFEYNCIFNNCFIGQDLTERLIKAQGSDVRKVEYFYETIEQITYEVITETPRECQDVNGTYYSCPDTIITNETIQRPKWNGIASQTSLPKGTHKIKAVVSYAPHTGIQAVDWIPIIDLKQSRYPEISKDIRAEKTEWAWFNVSWWNCRNIEIGVGDNSNVVNELIYNFNITGLTFANATQEVRIVDAACRDGGNVVDSQVYHSSDGLNGDAEEWAEVAFRFSGTNSTWSVYYNATGVTSAMNEFIVSKGNISAELWRGVPAQRFETGNELISDIASGIEIYQFSTDGTPDGDENAQYTFLFNDSTDYHNFTTDEINYVWAKLYSNVSHNAGIRTCKTVTCDPTGAQQINYWSPWAALPTGSYAWINSSNVTTYSTDMYGVAFYFQNAPSADLNMWAFIEQITFCKDCNISDNVFFDFESEQPQIPPRNDTNVTLIVNVDTADFIDTQSSSVCINNDTLQIDTFVYSCLGQEEDNPYCFWTNTTRYELCTSGCVNSTGQIGGQCAYTEFETMIWAVILFVVLIGVLFWLFRRR